MSSGGYDITQNIVDGGCGCGGDMSGGAEGDSFGQAAYSGTATFGRVYATIGAVIGIIIMLILIFAGYSKLKDPHTAPASATVTRVDSCSKRVQNKNTVYECSVSVGYTVSGVKYVVDHIKVTRPMPIQIGEHLTIYYNPAKPQDAVYELPPRELGWGLIGGGLLIGGITTGIAYATYKSKAFAAGYGALEAVSSIAGRGF